MTFLKNLLSTLVVLLGSYVAAFQYGGAVDGAMSPVVTNVKIETLEPVGETRSRITGSFLKIRQCDFVDLHFFLGTPENSARAEIVFEEGAVIRDAGYEDFGPWRVQLDPAQFRSNSFSRVYHQCYWEPLGHKVAMPWLTETVFHPGTLNGE